MGYFLGVGWFRAGWLASWILVSGWVRLVKWLGSLRGGFGLKWLARLDRVGLG